MGLSISKLLSGLFGKKEMRACPFLPLKINGSCPSARARQAFGVFPARLAFRREKHIAAASFAWRSFAERRPARCRLAFTVDTRLTELEALSLGWIAVSRLKAERPENGGGAGGRAGAGSLGKEEGERWAGIVGPVCRPTPALARASQALLPPIGCWLVARMSWPDANGVRGGRPVAPPRHRRVASITSLATTHLSFESAC